MGTSIALLINPYHSSSTLKALFWVFLAKHCTRFMPCATHPNHGPVQLLSSTSAVWFWTLLSPRQPLATDSFSSGISSSRMSWILFRRGTPCELHNGELTQTTRRITSMREPTSTGPCFLEVRKRLPRLL